MKLLKVGELARQSGLTVRTLHHYDDIGLLRPARRSAAGYRLYGTEDVARLARILLLRRLGLSLEEIGRCLSDPSLTLQHTVELHMDRLRRHIDLQQRLLARLETLTRRLDGARELTLDELTDTMETLKMFDKYYTPEQLSQLEDRAQQVGADRIRQVEQEWQELFTAFAAAHGRGDDPASEEVQALAQRANGLIAEFTGSDPGIASSLGNMYRQEGGPQVLGRHGIQLDPEVWELMNRAMALQRGSS